MKHLIKQIIAAVLLIGLTSTVMGAEKKYLTKGDVIMLLSTSDVVKKKVNEMLSWTVGYDVSKVNSVSLTPIINYIKAVPKKIPPDGKTILSLYASVDDPGGIKNIAGVRADLTAIGHLPNAAMFGDVKKEPGVFSLQTDVSPKIALGIKDIPVSVTNKKGWLALAKTSLEVKINPEITGIRVYPERVLANSKTLVTITVQIENPGSLADVKEATADLKAFGLPERRPLRNDGKNGDALAGDDLWTLQLMMSETTAVGDYEVPVEVSNLIGGVGTDKATVSVTKK